MLKRLYLKNFRKHEDLELSFSNGIIVVRGANEAGKSTLAEGIAYAMFGAKACRQPLDEVVSWGKSVNSLRVDLTFSIDGVDYSIGRSKSGAELRYEGGVVTGQTEVTGFVERLLGAPAKLATSLWFVSQNSIRGALESGSSATAQLIEQLADFELVDRIVDLIQTNLPTGNAKAYEERLKQAQDNLETFREEVQPPSQFAIDWLSEAGGEVAKLEDVVRTSKAAYEEFDREVLTPLISQRDNLSSLSAALSTLEATAESKRKEAESVTVPESVQAQILETMEKKAKSEAAVREFSRLQQAYKEFKGLPDCSECLWEGDEASFDRFVADLRKRREANTQRLYELKTDLKVETAALISQGTCGLCGKDLSEVPEVVTKNATTKAKIDAMNAEMGDLKKQSVTIEEEVAAVAQIQKMQGVYRNCIAKCGDLIRVEDVSVPPRVVWNALVPVAEAMPDYNRILRELEATEQKRTGALAQLDLLQSQLDQAVQKLNTAKVELEQGRQAHPNLEKDVEAAEKKSLELTRIYLESEEELGALKEQIKETQTAVETQGRLYAMFKKSKGHAEELCKKAEEELENLNLNNVLLKKVRASRPAIVDRLWTVVLSAVSYYFGAMRGTSGVSVVRADGGFLVDGKATEGLSGSTLDILGLSIRLALLKTFLPNCSFLLLDEPAAACDDNREASLIGTVATSHFDQVLLVTHSDVADAYANQLVTF